eukprot:1086744-Rhodomonas_salina.3
MSGTDIAPSFFRHPFKLLDGGGKPWQISHWSLQVSQLCAKSTAIRRRPRTLCTGNVFDPVSGTSMRYAAT